MNYYQKKLEEKKNYPYSIPEEKKEVTRKKKIHALKHTKKNAQFGMF